MRVARLVMFGLIAAVLLLIAAVLTAQIVFAPHLTAGRTTLCGVLLAGAILAAIACFRQFRNIRGTVAPVEQV